MEYMIKLNGKVFTVINRIPGQNWKAVCPTGHICHISANLRSVYHRDVQGRIQTEVVL